MKLIKHIEIYISVKYFYRKNKVFQHFIFISKKSNFKYLKDSKYLLYDKLHNKIHQLSLTNKNCIFLNKREEENKIVLEFEDNTGSEYEEFYFTLSDFIPPNTGCAFCIYKKESRDKDIHYCEFQNNKIYTKDLKRCRYFKQKKII